MRSGNTDYPGVLTITKQGGDITFAQDDKILLEYHDDAPLKGNFRFNLGGILSRLHLGEVSVIDLDGG